MLPPIYPAARTMAGVALTACAAITAAPLAAQSASAPDEAQPSETDGSLIIVRAGGRGAVTTSIVPVEELSAQDIASYGAGSAEELIAALSTSSNSGRGRGGGRPVILINGRVASSFRAVRDLPPEAIERVQIFPEELALQYGFRPDQRVINFILKPGYIGLIGDIEYGQPSRGGQGHQEVEATLSRIGENNQLNLDIEYAHETALTEAERGIIQPDSDNSIDSAVDRGAFRTLIARQDRVQANAIYSHNLGKDSQIAVNATYSYALANSLNGLPSANFFVPASSPFARSAQDENITRDFVQSGALERRVESDSYQLGGAFNHNLAGWRLSLTADYSRTDTQTLTERGFDITALQAAISAGTTDPFAADLSAQLGALRTDSADVRDQTLQTLASLAGTLADLPAGALTATLSATFNRQDLDSRAVVADVATRSDLGRSRIGGAVNIDVPLIDSQAVGKLAVNGNIGYADLSDFGGLREFGFGLNWEPIDGLTLSASAIGDEEAPTIQQLGNPQIITPNAPFFDFAQGQSALVSIISGGNPALRAERRRDIKLAVNYRPEWLDGLSVLGEFFRNRSRNVAAAFPALTAAVEAAFPERVVRDRDGNLLSVDQRPVNYSEVRSDTLRYGVDFSKRFAGRGSGEGGRGGRGGRGGGAPGTGFGPGSEGGRWQASLFHTVRFTDDVLIRPGVPILDFLGGAASGAGGGNPRHALELQGGWFNKGIGFRLSANHQSGTSVTSGTAGSALDFSATTRVDVRVFFSFDERKSLVTALPFLKGARVSLRIDNVFDDIQDVRDASGMVPLRFQPGFLEPLGRYIEVDFRKRF